MEIIHYGHFARLLLTIVAMSLYAPLLTAGPVLPDSLVTEENVYRYTFSDTELSEKIMAELRRQGRQPAYELDMTEGDLYYNTGRIFIATRFYKVALAAKAVKRDEQKSMKLLHRLISCYDGLYDEERKAVTVDLLLQKAR